MKFLIQLMCIMIPSLLRAQTLTINNPIQWSIEKQIISPSQDINSDITRKDAAKLYVNIVKYYRGTDIVNQILPTINKPCTFADIDKNDVLNDIITDSCKLGIFKGSNGSFLPNTLLTPAEAMVTLMRILAGKQDENTNPRRQNYYNLASKNGVIPAQDLSLIQSGQTLPSSKILSWIYNADKSTTLKNESSVQNNSLSDFISASKTVSNITTSGVDVIQQKTVSINNPKIGDIITEMQRNTITMCNKGQCNGPQSRFAKWKNTDLRRLPWLLFLLLAYFLRALIKHIINLFCGGYDQECSKDNSTYSKNKYTTTTHHVHHEDLKIIDGIGPEIEQILYDNRITTLAQIANMTPDQLSTMLKKYKLSIAQLVIQTRPQQASLARDGKITELKQRKKQLNNDIV